MTSPDNAGLPDPGSGWEGLGIAGLGPFLIQSMIVRPLSKILSLFTGRPPEDFDTQAELEAEANEVVSGITGWLGNIPIIGDLIKAAQGITTGLAGGMLVVANTFLGRWSQANDTEAVANDTVADVYDLQTRAQALEGVVGYASARMSGAFTPGTAFARVPFNTPLGPRVGVDHSASTSEFTLTSKGLWEFSYKVTWDLLLGPVSHGAFTSLVVRDSFGAEFYRASMLQDTNDSEWTMNETGRFVVPAAGYKVSVEARGGVNYRGLRGEVGFNQLNVVKISDETS